MKKKSIIILVLMIVLSILLNYTAFFGISIAGFKYDSLFGRDIFNLSEDKAPANETATEAKDDAEKATEEEATEEPAKEEATEEATEDKAAETTEAAEDTAAETTEGAEDAASETTEATETPVAATADTGRIRKGIDLAGGSVISFEAEAENVTEEQMDVVEAIFNTRLNAAGYTEARISRGDLGQITVEIPSVFETDEAATLLGSAAQLKFVDADGNEVLSGDDVKNAEYKYGQTKSNGASESYVELTLTKEAVTKFAEATEKAAGAGDGKNYIAIMMDENIVSAPRVSERIDSETCIISGEFTPETARNLANQIKSGALPFSMKILSQDTIGAELGKNALPLSLIAALIGILLVMLFMIVMYRIPGLIADLSLTLYIAIVAWILGIFRVNLSLSGIAGIVLSIGMAVDANVIIFERMKEEMNLGKTIKASVESGFKKAFTAIVDSNVTTIITCIVLYLSGIGTVRGFAVTLGIGVVVSMFTAITITKFLLKQVVNLQIKNRGLICKQKKKKEEAE